MGGQWVDGVGMWGGAGSLEGKSSSGGSSGSMGMWDEAVKNQGSLRGNSNNNMGLKNSRSSPSLTYVILQRNIGFLDKTDLYVFCKVFAWINATCIYMCMSLIINVCPLQ